MKKYMLTTYSDFTSGCPTGPNSHGVWVTDKVTADRCAICDKWVESFQSPGSRKFGLASGGSNLDQIKM